MKCLQLSDQFPNGIPLTKEELNFWIAKHDAEFPTEADCLEALVAPLIEDGTIRCPCCHSKNIARKHGSRKGKCRECAEEIWLTAKTFLEGAKKMRAWHLAFWLRDQGISLSSNGFALLVGVSPSTGWEMDKKIAVVVERKMPDVIRKVCSGEFLTLFSKRSRETPAREHPRQEQLIADEQAKLIALQSHVDQQAPPEPLSDRNAADETMEESDQSDPPRSGLDERERLVLSLLTYEPIHFDQLLDVARKHDDKIDTGRLSAALTLLELKEGGNVIERKSGDYYVLKAKPEITTDELLIPTDEQKSWIGRFKAFVEILLNKSISRKHLQSYLAGFWYFTDRVSWGKGSLLKECLKHTAIKPENLHTVTPYMVKLMPIPAC